MATALISGVGPVEGLGAQLCIRFAALGLHVIAGGRTPEKLEAVVEIIRSDGGTAEGVIADATNEEQTRDLFRRAGKHLSLAIYNTGNNTPGHIVDMSAEYFEEIWRVCCLGGFLFGREAIRNFSEGGTLIFTGASASLRGRENFGAFNSAKGALRNLAQAMAKEYGRDGVHVGYVVVDGPIGGEKIKLGYPDYAAHPGEKGMIDIAGHRRCQRLSFSTASPDLVL